MSFPSKMVLFMVMSALMASLLLSAAVESAPAGSTSSSSSSSTKATASASGGRTKVSLKQAMKIVEKRKLKECVARTICILSCDANALGDKGQAVYHTLQQFESDTLPGLAYYKEARDKGQALPKGQCQECTDTLYANCKTPTDTLLRLANALTIEA